MRNYITFKKSFFFFVQSKLYTQKDTHFLHNFEFSLQVPDSSNIQ